jgi:predicted transcriptional regulator
MHIDLPQDFIQRVQQRAASGQGMTEADVIRKALDTLDWHDAERMAIQEGIDAMNAGRVQGLDEFDGEFRQKNGIASTP